MRKQLYLLCLLLIAGLAATSQIKQKNKHTVSFHIGKTNITFSNNWLKGNDGRKYTPYYFTSAEETFHYHVTGEELIISIVEFDTLLNIAGYGGHYNADTLLAHQHLYTLRSLQARITRNGNVGNWLDIEKLPSFPDPSITYKRDPKQFKTSYWLLKEKLAVGDSVYIEFRRNEGIPLMKLHVKRIPLEKRPFIYGGAHDTSSTRDERTFIQNQFLYIYPMYKQSEAFYTDWPARIDHYDQAYWPTSRLAFYLWEPPGVTDSTFQYRLQGGQYKDTSWHNCRGIIIVPSLQTGAHYRLDVRYKDAPALWNTRYFHVPPYWYQTLWFKITTGAVLVAFCLFLFLVLAYRRNKRQEEKRRLKMQSLYAQLNPHFVFNALGSIQGLMNDQQIEKANQYLSGFALLLRSSMLSTSKETIPLKTELKNLDNYIQLEILRFNFQYELYVDPSLPQELIEVPPLLAQPLIENAVKHGVSAKGPEGRISFRVMKEKQDIVFSISDNGPGFDPSQTAGRHGIKLTKDRIDLFNRKHRHITLDIQTNTTGTTVLLRFKNWLEND